MINTLSFIQDDSAFTSLDIHFGRFAARFSERHQAEVGLAAALVSRFTREGHICIDLNEEAAREFLPNSDPDHWRSVLLKCSFVGSPGQTKPLILDDRNRLYLHRYWKYQEALAAGIKKRISIQNDYDSKKAKAVLETLFPSEARDDRDWQKIAALTALTYRFCVITGGPGTGKTTTVTRLLALILELGAIQGDRIALLSPTGKGAVRLKEAITARDILPAAEKVKESLVKNTATIHRFLGAKPGSSTFRFHRKNRLPLDMAIIDEASMVDLPLMSKFVQALPDHAKLLLLGDKDQLASVEAGAVLGDICAEGTKQDSPEALPSMLQDVQDHKVCSTKRDAQNVALADCIVHLRHSFRFEKSSGIGSLSQAIKEGKGREAANLLREKRFSDLCFHPVPSSKDLSKALKASVVHGFRGYLAREDPRESLFSFEGFRILCALREGPFGIRAVNDLVETCLEEAGLIHRNREWYPGRPVMITKNDYRLGLFNGDVGITFQDAAGDLRVMFQDQDGSHRMYHPHMLSAHETTFAVTVHKSQGSEFDRVLFLLPDHDLPILSRELIYTGISRAKEQVDLWGSVEVFRAAVKRQTYRTSGLRDILWGT